MLYLSNRGRSLVRGKPLSRYTVYPKLIKPRCSLAWPISDILANILLQVKWTPNWDSWKKEPCDYERGALQNCYLSLLLNTACPSLLALNKR